MSLVVGIDPSSRKIAAVAVETITGTQVIDKQNLYPKGTTTQTPASLHNALTFMRCFGEKVQHMAPEGRRFAYVESPVVGRGGPSGTIKQAFVGGIIRACLVDAGFVVYDVNVGTWRSTLGIKVGKGRTTKVVKMDTEAAVRNRWPKVIPGIGGDGDLIDAAAICLHGAEQVRKGDLIRPT